MRLVYTPMHPLIYILGATCVCIGLLVGAGVATMQMQRRRQSAYPNRPIDGVHFFHPGNFDILARFNLNFRAIAAEAAACLSAAPISSYIRPYDKWVHSTSFIDSMRDADGWIRTQDETSHAPNTNWLNYAIMYRGTVFPNNVCRCPHTAAILSSVCDRINIAGFSLMRPHSKIHPHTDRTGLRDGSLAYHLGLIVPPKQCCLYVGSVRRREKNGRAIVFDSNITHHADNTSNADRVILYIDFSLLPRTY